jgi:hypothetical protein
MLDREQIVTHFSGFWDTEGVQTTILEYVHFCLGITVQLKI